MLILLLLLLYFGVFDVMTAKKVTLARSGKEGEGCRWWRRHGRDNSSVRRVVVYSTSFPIIHCLHNTIYSVRKFLITLKFFICSHLLSAAKAEINFSFVQSANCVGPIVYSAGAVYEKSHQRIIVNKEKRVAVSFFTANEQNSLAFFFTKVFYSCCHFVRTVDGVYIFMARTRIYINLFYFVFLHKLLHLTLYHQYLYKCRVYLK